MRYVKIATRSEYERFIEATKSQSWMPHGGTYYQHDDFALERLKSGVIYAKVSPEDEHGDVLWSLTSRDIKDFLTLKSLIKSLPERCEYQKLKSL